MKYDAFIFLGRSGSGKGTQAELLEKRLIENNSEVSRIEMGAGFRNLKKKSAYTQELISKKINNGELPPEFLSTWVFVDQVIKNIDKKEPIIFDGYPRFSQQKDTMDSLLNFYKYKNIAIVYLNLNREIAKGRLLKRKRDDDTEESIEKRFNWYEKELSEIISFFDEKEKYEIIDIDGSKSIEEIYKDICDKLKI